MILEFISELKLQGNQVNWISKCYGFLIGNIEPPNVSLVW
jgi:hypothetical protein